MFIADIVAVNVDETLLDEKGKLELEKAGLLAFAHGEYFRLGEKVGEFRNFPQEKRTLPKRIKLPRALRRLRKRTTRKRRRTTSKTHAARVGTTSASTRTT